ncbi:hypothetical protein ACFFMR_03885 [Micromonospora andamanensis]|uniref:Uncharacterized protein n=1 Tax=Micromonospora andamanensis TaxID=1287068 RepID=A0ABQ4I5K7_9ACTN|nr:hypothetical protein [Micromonospora andamanensis]GIJ13170.1 hypothetical protein Van01_63840 [Micromonospora andamanensis]
MRTGGVIVTDVGGIVVLVTCGGTVAVAVLVTCGIVVGITGRPH